MYGVYYVCMVYFMSLLSVLCIYGSFYASVVRTIDAGMFVLLTPDYSLHRCRTTG